MNVQVRWPRLRSRWSRMILPAIVLLALVFNQTALMVLLVAVGVVWCVRDVRVVLRGGGFRPLRMIDLIEFAADDQLTAWEREQASR